MSREALDKLSQRSLAELFRMEVETQSAILTNGLLALEREPNSREILEQLMRAAHSLKGAARIVGRQSAAQIAHGMEDCVVAVQHGKLTLTAKHVDILLAGVDLLGKISRVEDNEFERWQTQHDDETNLYLRVLLESANSKSEIERALTGQGKEESQTTANRIVPDEDKRLSEPSFTSTRVQMAGAAAARPEGVLRVTADNLNSLLGFAGEALVSSRWLDDYVSEMGRVRKSQRALVQSCDRMAESITGFVGERRTAGSLQEIRERIAAMQELLAERTEELEGFNGRFINLSSRLYQEVLNCRMRPFADGARTFPRTARDLAHSLGKKVRVDIVGESTSVDREILERLQAPLDHLIRNAIDHGIEFPTERHSLGKTEYGTVQLQARHSAGTLLITIRDDGRGIDSEAIRRAVVRNNLASAEMAQKLSESELFEFLFLPGFTLAETVTEISGRGVGLDIVHAMAKQVGGSARVSAVVGRGTFFSLELPLTLSVIRTLIVEIGGEPYAFPLARVDSVLKLCAAEIESLEGRQHFSMGEQQIGLIAATQILELDSSGHPLETCVVVLGEKNGRYGLVVDKFVGEQELVVRPLDSRLGKVKNINAASLMPDGSPVLIIDVDDMLRHIKQIVSGKKLSLVGKAGNQTTAGQHKRVLVVDDSLTVRELERKLLGSQGYLVDVAVDGMEGWNAVRTGGYDLVVTDVDMPHMDGIELVRLIRQDSRLKTLPVMIVSYKDRQDDRARGLEAGADYYLTKGSFHDDTLVMAVADLIGGPNK